MQNTLMEIKRLARLLGAGPGEIVKLAREVSHDGTIVCLSQLRNHERAEMLQRLESIARSKAGREVAA